MGYEFENSVEKELLRKLKEAIDNLENHLNANGFPGIPELHIWHLNIEQRIKWYYRKDQNASIRSSNSKTSVDK